ncbi:DUF3343 domain-containing protein [Pelobacter seleniigenes]|uniref:DUF3343 domain-containing protein n=1 Tax=Pelobacter seleniigenes TaxID=407188 RepID=UPI0004A75AE4|nr:DUF3343 domain-containing protein [Pelobacter seleniigenes]
MVENGDIVAIFHSIHRVMKAEKVLKHEQLKVKVIPVPRQLSADCGMAVTFSEALLPQVRAALDQAGLVMVEVWQLDSGVFCRLM